MSLESDLQTLLKTVTTRVYPDFAPNGTAEPYIVWKQLGGVALRPLGREVPNRRGALIAVSVWSKTRSEANTLALAADSALRQASVFDAKPQGEFMAVTDDDNETRGTIQMFEIHGYR